MSEALQLPCRRCGRLVAVPVQAGMGLPLCDTCASRPGSVRYRVHRPGFEDELDFATVVARLRKGDLRNTDYVSSEGFEPTPMAAHPAFRDLFLGEGAPTPTSRARTVPVSYLVVPVLAGLLVVSVAGAGWWFWSHRPPTVEVTAAPVPATAVPGAAVVRALQAQSGAVGEPSAKLVAAAWEERGIATPEALARATGFAEAAVARAPDGVEGLAMLASLYTARGVEPERAKAVLDRARALAPDSPYVAAADAETALARADADEARAAVARCLAAAPEDLVCREIADRLRPGSAAERLAGTAALAARWPEHRGLGRRAALLAVEAGAPDAEAGLDAALRRYPGDVVLTREKARLRFRAGDLAAADLARSLGKDAPADVVAGLAGRAIAVGDPAGALAWVELPGPGGTRDEQAQLALRRAQALILEGRATPGDAALAQAAFDAAGAAVDLAPGDPAAIQARMLAALPRKDFAAGQRALDRLDASAADPRELAALQVARAAMDLAQGVPAQAQHDVEEALRLDPAAAQVHLWAAWVAVQGQNGAGALAALRKAVRGVSGTTRPPERMLGIPADRAALTNGLVTLVGSDMTRERDLALGMAVLDWLGDEPDRALARVSAAVGGSDDADLWGLYARLLVEKQDYVGAGEAVDRAQALAHDPAWPALAAAIRAHVSTPVQEP